MAVPGLNDAEAQMTSPETRNYFLAADFLAINVRVLPIAIVFHTPSHAHSFSVHPPTSTPQWK